MIVRILARGWPTILVLAGCLGIGLASAMRSPAIVLAVVAVMTGRLRACVAR